MNYEAKIIRKGFIKGFTKAISCYFFIFDYIACFKKIEFS